MKALSGAIAHGKKGYAISKMAFEEKIVEQSRAFADL